MNERNYPEYGHFMSHIFPYKDKMYDYVFMWEKTAQRNPVVCYILRNDILFSGLLSELFNNW